VAKEIRADHVTRVRQRNLAQISILLERLQMCLAARVVQE
jgi:hypothetical protein